MTNEELNVELKTLTDNLAGKTSAEIKAELKAFETSYNLIVENKAKEMIESELKTFKEELEVQYRDEIKAVQDHADQLDVKLKAKVSGSSEKNVDPIMALVTKNFDSIKTVKKGNAINIEEKDMTLAVNLVGDQPRDYSSTVAMLPSQLINVADLCQSITISGGTYTFPQENAPTGAPDTQVEGALKEQIEYAVTMVDANTDFIAGFAVYSKKMANNLPFLEGYLPNALRRDYWKSENSIFNTILATDATASDQIITGSNKVQMLIADLAALEEIDYSPTAMVTRPADFYDILVTEVSTGSGYGLPGVVTFENGQLRINGIPVYKATWVGANGYYVGDFTTVKKVITQGLAVNFSNEDSDNFRKNNITARVEAQVTLTLERPDSVIIGDFTATTP